MMAAVVGPWLYVVLKPAKLLHPQSFLLHSVDTATTYSHGATTAAIMHWPPAALARVSN
jgi:hypothetical protein